MADAIINVNGDQVQSLEIILFMGLLSIQIGRAHV